MLAKSMLRAFAFAVATAALSAPALADDYPTAIGNKVGRGLANLSLGWVELVKNSYDEPLQHGPMYVPVGLAKGLYHTIGRTLSGIADTATFMIPTKPFIHANYVWEDFERETSYGDQYWK